jgi:hypothetical protein
MQCADESQEALSDAHNVLCIFLSVSRKEVDRREIVEFRGENNFPNSVPD